MESHVIGKLGKPHGLKGEIRVLLDQDRVEDLLEQSDFILVKGLPYSVRHWRSAGGLVVLLEGIEDRSAAEILRGAPIALPLTTELKEVLQEDPVQQWIDYSIHDLTSNQTYGPITEVIELPTQLTAVVIQDGRDVLIPLHESLILDIDPVKKLLTMDLPAGLIDLYLE